jgi:ABC-2 type transport system ATP-binding protein
MDALLQLNKVVKRFEANTVLDEVSFTLEPGMVVGLLGANGAGKSTLMRIALGIIDADAGDIATLGKPQSN